VADIFADLNAAVALIPVRPALFRVGGAAVGAGAGYHANARRILLAAWPTVVPSREPTQAELCVIQALAAFDGAYGSGRLAGTNNWGAIHQGFPSADGTCPGTGKLLDDYNAKTKQRYPVCFKTYATPELGAADVIRKMVSNRPTVAQYMREGRDLQTITRALFRSHYFGGFRHDDDEGNVSDYAMNLWAKITAICAELEISIPIERGTPGHGPLAPDSPPPGQGSPPSSSPPDSPLASPATDQDGPGLGWFVGLAGAVVAVYVAAKS
jgi:hypothetical protein